MYSIRAANSSRPFARLESSTILNSGLESHSQPKAIPC
jgi:hypothetical protein